MRQLLPVLTKCQWLLICLFIVETNGDKIILTSHFAKNNPHREHLTTKQNLIIFNEPHAYISPRYYDKKQQVPTWNYMAVHAYGKGKLIQQQSEVFHVLEKMISNFESDYLKQWSELDMEYKTRMANGITAFEIEIEEIQFKKKLSQNKNEQEQKRIANELDNSANSHEKQVAEYMSKTLNQSK